MDTSSGATQTRGPTRPQGNDGAHPAKPIALVVSQEPESIRKTWGPDQIERLRRLVDLELVPWDGTALLSEQIRRHVNIMFSTWGMPCMSDADLDNFPRLQAIFYAAGSVKAFAEPFLRRGIRVFSAWAANAIPVAEYSLSQILFGLKKGWLHHRSVRQTPGPGGWKAQPVAGVYGSTVGIVSLGMIGLKVVELLGSFDVKIAAYDPFVKNSVMESRGIIPLDLRALFSSADVVSIHTPWLKETEGIVSGHHIRSMREGATLINTSRGAVINQVEMNEALADRPDLTAVLDVTWPEPPASDSPLYSLPNVILTPHISGSLGNESHRLADLMIEECSRWLDGQPPRYEITLEKLPLLA